MQGLEVDVKPFRCLAKAHATTLGATSGVPISLWDGNGIRRCSTMHYALQRPPSWVWRRAPCRRTRAARDLTANRGATEPNLEGGSTQVYGLTIYIVFRSNTIDSGKFKVVLVWHRQPSPPGMENSRHGGALSEYPAWIGKHHLYETRFNTVSEWTKHLT